ncbi:MAG: radical SAM protein [Coriobacteriales bacterium]|nr:radical SAM protein [Coriobacteriales bacterium]
MAIDKENILLEDEALCPHCMQVLPAIIYKNGKTQVYMTRTCPDHGEINTYLWPDANHYMSLYRLRNEGTLPKTRDAKITDKCCKSCGLCARHIRRSTLVEIEVTKRCNMKCPVCFMSADNTDDGISFEEIEGLIKTLAHKVGPETGLQITGGEPTVRDDLADIVRCAKNHGFEGIEINTNGLKIAQDIDYLQSLVDAGITGVYIAFDGLTPNIYKEIRGSEAVLDMKLKAIENCRKLGCQVVICMTIVKGINEDQVGDIVQFALDNSDVIFGVALQPAFTSGRFEPSAVPNYSMGDTIFDLEKQTNGLIKVEDIWPLGCSHPHCDTGTFMILDEDANWYPVTRGLSKEQYIESYDSASPQGSVFADILHKRGITTSGGVSIIIMNYMDALTTTISRMKECSMTVAMKDGRVIPFCSYQMTNSEGVRLYNMWGEEK